MYNNLSCTFYAHFVIIPDYKKFDQTIRGMNRMKKHLIKKRLLSMALIAVMTAFLLPMTVFADTSNTPINLKDATADTSGENWSWDNTSKTLYLNGVDIDSGASAAIRLPNFACTIELTGTNTVTSVLQPTGSDDLGKGTVHAPAHLTIRGSGTLNASNTWSSGFTNETAAISVQNNLTIESGTINATIAGNNSNGLRIHSGSLTVNGGNINTSGSCGIYVSSSSVINGGNVKAISNPVSGTFPSAIYSASGFTINGGYIEAIINNHDTPGNIYAIYAGSGDFIINDGVLKASSADTTNGHTFGVFFKERAEFNGGETTASAGNAGSGKISAAVIGGFAGSVPGNIPSKIGTIILAGGITANKAGASGSLYTLKGTGTPYATYYTYLSESPADGSAPAKNVAIATSKPNADNNAAFIAWSNWYIYTLRQQLARNGSYVGASGSLVGGSSSSDFGSSAANAPAPLTLTQEINAATVGGTVQANMSPGKGVTKSELLAAKGSDINVVLNYGTYNWAVNGKTIGVLTNVDEIDLSITESKQNGATVLDVAYSGALPFTATLTYPAADAANGTAMYLYNSKSSTGKPEQLSVGVVKDGMVSFPIKFASQYTLTVTKLK